MKVAAINSDKGFVLVAAMVILLALTVMGVVMMNTAALESRIAGADRENASAIFLAEAGAGKVREWFQFPETFSPTAADIGAGISAYNFKDCTPLAEASLVVNSAACSTVSFSASNAPNFFRRRFAELGKREFISNATQYSQFTDLDANGVRNVAVDSYNPTDETTDRPALTIENQSYLDALFSEFAGVGSIKSIKIYPPISQVAPRSGPNSARPRPICTARITSETKGGVRKTVEVEILESIFLTIDGGAEAGSAASWNGHGTVHWGKVMALGNVEFQSLAEQKACNGAAELTYSTGDPGFKALVNGTVSKQGAEPTANNCTDCIAIDPDLPGCDLAGTGMYDPANRPWQEYNIYQNQTVTLDNWEKTDMQDFSESLGTYYRLDTATNKVYKSDRDGNQLGAEADFTSDWLKNNRDPFMYLDARKADGSEGGTVNLQVTGSFYREGDIYIDGDLDFGGGGNGENIQVLDPSGATQTLTDINFRGVLYMTGSLKGNGSPKIYGGVVAAGGGLQSQGAPEIWYDKELMEGRRTLPKTGKGMWREIM